MITKISRLSSLLTDPLILILAAWIFLSSCQSTTDTSNSIDTLVALYPTVRNSVESIPLTEQEEEIVNPAIEDLTAVSIEINNLGVRLYDDDADRLIRLSMSNDELVDAYTRVRLSYLKIYGVVSTKLYELSKSDYERISRFHREAVKVDQIIRDKYTSEKHRKDAVELVSHVLPIFIKVGFILIGNIG